MISYADGSSLGTGRSINGTARCKSRVSASSRSPGVCPAGSSQSKAWTRVAQASATMRVPQLRPAHTLRPAPNGMKPYP